jgi:hypothetical protein
MQNYTPQDLKRWIEELLDPNTLASELRETAMTLARTHHLEALRALEEFQRSPRGENAEWLEFAIAECLVKMLSPANEAEEKDYMRVELWQRYERELFEMEGKREAAEVRIRQLQVEKEFLESIQELGETSQQKLAVQLELSGIDMIISLAENEIMNLDLEIEGQQFLFKQIERAIQSPIYRKYGREHVGMTVFRDCDPWLRQLEDE